MRSVLAVLAALAVWSGTSAQELPILRLKVSVLSPDRQPIPVARHALLISDNPVTAAPRRVVTSTEGIAQIRLRPGSYTVESDSPFVLDGRSYEWIQNVDVVSGRDTTLELTADEAGVVKANVLSDAATASSPNARERRDSILSTWQASAFELWTPLARAVGFLIDEHGLVATSLRAIGDATTVEVQVSQAVKVLGAVIVTDASRDVAIVRIHPSAVAGIPPVPLDCDQASPVPADPNRYVIDIPLFGSKDLNSTLEVSAGAAGGPVFSSDGRAVGLTSPTGRSVERRRDDVRLIVRESICEAQASARVKLDGNAPPADTRLPVEPTRRPAAKPGPATSAAARTFSFAPYELSSADFDILFVTPAVIAGADGRRGWTGGRADEPNRLRLATNFEDWSEYVAAAPPLLFVRVSPRLAESFWMKVARGAASTQGAQIPPIKRLRPGFSRMRVVCGDREVTPIHPFRIQARVTETDAIEEGFYVFDPDAIGPDCGTVSIVLSSVKDPDKTQTRAVDPAIVRRVWEDFAAVRATSVDK